MLGLALLVGGLAGWWISGESGIANYEVPGMFTLLAGAFALFGAVFDWDWFFGARRARLLAAILGRTGARYVYAGLGGGLIGAGMILALA